MTLRWDRLTGAVVTLGVLAWVAMALGGHGTHHAGHTITGWLLMVVAMMLPPALPLFQVVRRLTASHAYPGIAILIFVAVWTVAGVVLVAGTALAQGALLRVALPHEHMLLGAGLVLAGAWQFTPLKDACLTACRTPRGIAMIRWRGRPATDTAVIAGVYAASCVGCCWALMGAGLLTGAAGPAAMAVLTLLMAAERLTRWGRILVRPAGAAALVLGAGLLLGVDAAFH